MHLLELIATNNNFVTRKNLSTIFGNAMGPRLYNLGFTAFGEDIIMEKEVLVQRTARVVTATKVVIEFDELLKFLGRTMATPQSNYYQAVKSHEEWLSRKDYILDKLSEHRLIKAMGILKISYREELENAKE